MSIMDILITIRHWLVVIFLILFFAMIIVYNLAWLYYKIKCFKIKDCCNRKCNFKIFCYKYYEKYTDEEIARMRKFLEESGLPGEVKPKNSEKNTD